MRYLAFFLMLSICVGCKDRPFNEQAKISVGADEDVLQKESDDETNRHDLDETAHDSVRSGLALAPPEGLLDYTAPPRITVEFSMDHAGAKEFDELDGNVYFYVTAEDESKIVDIKVIAPARNNKVSENVFGPITPKHVQNAREIAKTCGQEDRLLSEIVERGLSIENVFCACFEATDSHKNVAKKLHCFQRPEPTCVIDSPLDRSMYSFKDDKNGVKIKAKVVSGADFSECSWRLFNDNWANEKKAMFSPRKGRIENNECMINERIDLKTLGHGLFFLKIHAVDSAGRVLNKDEAILHENATTFYIVQ